MNIEKYPIIYEGSVKNLREIKKATRTQPGKILFEYTDDFSVFDWGKMPDEIKGKGASMAILAACIFELIEGKISNTHYLGIASKEGKIIKRLSDLKEPSNVIAVRSVNIRQPFSHTTEYGNVIYEYNPIFNPRIKNYLIPLENIFRFGCPKGSSLLERASDPKYLKEIGLDEKPKEGEWLPHVVLEYFTKLEPGDRHLNLETALNYSGLYWHQFLTKQTFTKNAANFLKEFFGKVGLDVWDGKFEYAKDHKNEIMMVDAVGIDELRLIKDGAQISKEPIRQWYKKNDAEWFAAFKQYTKDLGDAKKAKEECIRKGIMPKKLDPEFLETVEFMYMAIANECTGREWFKGVPSLDKIINKFGG